MLKDKIFGIFFRGDKIIWTVLIALCVISVMVVFSATSTIAYKYSDHWGPVFRHAFLLMMGICGVMIFQQIPPRFFSFSILAVVLSIVLLMVTSLKGTSTNDASRWLNIGAFSFQPSEIAKLSVVCAMAFLLSKMNDKNKNVIFYVIIGMLLIVCGIIFFDNFSTALLLGFVSFLMMVIGQVPGKKLWALIGIVIVAVAIFGSVIFLWPEDKIDKLGRAATWKARLERFDNQSDAIDADTYKITDENRQVSHANIAIARGGLIGLPGSGQQRDYLPQAYSDFIFAIILEETGFLGGLIVMSLYLILLFRCGIIAKKIDKKFYKYLIMGCALIIVVQAMVNMFVAVGILPVTGQPLPLLSRGGTSVVITCIYFGIILSCSSKQNLETSKAIEPTEDGSIPEDLGVAENE